MSLDRKAAAGVLKKIATLLELHEENPHRVRAFGNAARAVERIEGDLGELVRSGDILEVKGIGKGTAGVLSELADNGKTDALKTLEDKTPAGVRDLLRVSGLGPKKVKVLWRDLDITGPGELEYACQENRLVELPGFGDKSQRQILESVRFMLGTRDRWLVHRATVATERLAEKLKAVAEVEWVEAAGALRRSCETVAGIELVVCGQAPPVEHALKTMLDEPEPMGSRTWSGTTSDGFPVTVRIAGPGSAAIALLWATGSRLHVDALRRQAAAVGLRLEEGEGLWSNGELVPCPDEEALYAALGCQWIPPELREDGDEVPRAARAELPMIVGLQDLRGVLHNHTTDSDGSGTLLDMAAAATELGWEFFGIADHSPAAHYANGLSSDRLRDQWRRIDDLNSTSSGARVIKGLEADILGDGSLDIPDGCEEGLEYVVASVHSGFRLEREAQTDRVVKAIRHPACRVLGHPTGRLLLARPGFEVNLERILEACAECGVAVEINASPYRLDLDWRWAKRAIELGIPVVINPDAHSVDGLGDVRWGVGVARKAGATREQVLNCTDIDEWISRGR